MKQPIVPPAENDRVFAPPLNPAYRIPVLVLDGDNATVVQVPIMSADALEFFKQQLDIFKPVITSPSFGKPPKEPQA